MRILAIRLSQPQFADRLLDHRLHRTRIRRFGNLCHHRAYRRRQIHHPRRRLPGPVRADAPAWTYQQIEQRDPVAPGRPLFCRGRIRNPAGSYRCHWGQHRARRSAEGDLQPPRHEIVDARNGKVLETRSKEVSRLVEQVTGMDYDRFTRSILLAQGDFAAFLEADADQRAPILEQITGTGIYSRISIAIHERTSEERKKTALLQEAMGAVFLLADEDEKALEAGISQGVAAVVELRQHLALLGTALHRIQTIRGLQEKIKDIDRLLLDLARRREEARGELLRLDRGQRARFLTGDYTRFKQNRGADCRPPRQGRRTSGPPWNGCSRSTGR